MFFELIYTTLILAFFLVCNWSTRMGTNKYTPISKSTKSINDMMAPSTRFAAVVSELNERGEGIIYHEGNTYRVSNGLPGDKLYVNVIRRGNTISEAEIVKINTRSSCRITSSCKIARDCGGCQFQHYNYTNQLQFKYDLITRAFSLYENLNKTIVNSVLSSSLQHQYRNKAQFAIQRDPLSNKVIVGLYKKKSHDVTDTEFCNIQHQLINDVLTQTRIFFGKFPHLSVYDEISRSGAYRHILIRIGICTKEIMICMVSAEEHPRYINQFVDAMCSMPLVKCVLLNWNNDPGDSILALDPSRTTVLQGNSPHIHDVIAGIKLKVSLYSFTQSNPTQANELYRTVAESLSLNGDETLYDLYCGIGIIGLYLSSRVRQVISVEDCSPAVDDATENAKLNNCNNIKFLCQSAEFALQNLPIVSNEIAVINPPRRGCDTKLLIELARRKLQKVAYVSCNPQTLARDIAAMIDLGYKIETVQPVDMFPQTVHVETVVLMKLSN